MLLEHLGAHRAACLFTAAGLHAALSACAAPASPGPGVTVVGHGWRRAIEVQQLQLVNGTAAPDQLPTGARVLGCEETCRYEVDQWVTTRTVEATGTLADPPTWPELALHAGGAFGGEREGARTERYTLQLQSADGATTCALPEATWNAVPDGTTRSPDDPPYPCLE